MKVFILNLKLAQALATNSVKTACDILELGYVDVQFLGGNKFENNNVSSSFDRYLYVVRFNNDWLINASEEEIVLTSYYQVRHGYQQTQIEFREQLINSFVFVEEIEKVKVWEEEFSYYTEPTGEEVNDIDYMRQDTVVDSLSFAYAFYKMQYNKDVKILECILDEVNERMIEIIKNNLGN